MSSYPSINASDEELERSIHSSEYSFENADYASSPNRRSRRSPTCTTDEPRPRQRRRLNARSSADDQQSSQLACPFAKHNPLKHRRCFKYKMDQISRLKQHLFRVHQTPIHCVRCSQTFVSEDERDAHLRHIPGCSIQPSQTWEGISEAQKRQLAQRVSSKKSKEENWYLVYDIMFPASARPQSPYLDGTQFSEELFALREYAVRDAPSRIAEITSTFQYDSTLPQASKQKLEAFALSAVKDVLDTVIDRWLRGGISAADLEHPDTIPIALSPAPTVPMTYSSPSVSVDMTSFPSQTQCVDPRQTSRKIQPLADQQTSGSGGLLGDGHAGLAIGVEEQSGLDWLSMVASMDWKTWDEHLLT